MQQELEKKEQFQRTVAKARGERVSVRQFAAAPVHSISYTLISQ